MPRFCPAARTSQGDVPGPGQASATPVFMATMKIFFRFYLPCRRQHQASPSSIPSSPQSATVEETIRSHPQLYQPVSARYSACVLRAASSRLPETHLINYAMPGSGPGPPRPAKSVRVSPGSRQKLPCCSLGRLALRLQLPGPHHRIGVGSKICLSLSAHRQQQPLCAPMSCSAPCPQDCVSLSLPAPLTLLSAAAPLPLPVRGASTMCVPHAEL